MKQWQQAPVVGWDTRFLNRGDVEQRGPGGVCARSRARARMNARTHTQGPRI